MNAKENYIAVFDSGLGGISVLRHLMRELPNEKFLYFGDSANAPYGTRSREAVEALTMDAAERLIARGAKALVVACNTATSAAIEALRQRWPERIIIGIEPALKPAVTGFPGGTIAVMATPMTLREEKFNALCDRFGASCRIVRIPAPGLVELVEAGKANSPESEALLRKLLEPWIGKLDAVVLGCTHYPFAGETIRRILGDSVVLFDGGSGTARNTKLHLQEENLLNPGPGELIMENSSPDPEILERAIALLYAGEK